MDDSLIEKLRPKWSRFIPHTPTVKQLAFLSLPHVEALYGGSAGGGKSDCVLMSALQFVDTPGYAAIIFRLTLSDLKKPGALIDRSISWLSGTGAKYIAGEHMWLFPTFDEHGDSAEPAKLVFGYIGGEGEANIQTRQQSSEYQFIGWDELGQHKENNYRYMFSRMRKLACPIHQVQNGKPVYVRGCPKCAISRSLPLRVRSATNPGGVGATWIKRRFSLTPVEDKSRPTGIRWVGKDPLRPFIPSYLADNPYLDQSTYEDSLEHLDPITKAQLKEGDWGASASSRFKRSWMRTYHRNGEYYSLGRATGSPLHTRRSFLRIFQTVDPAGSLREGPGESDIWQRMENSETVISTWGLTEDYHLLWLDCVHLCAEIPDAMDAIRSAFAKWHPQALYFDGNGLGRGMYQALAREGYPVENVMSQTDKLSNATDAMIRMKNGRVWFPEEAPWLNAVEEQVFSWMGHPYQQDDIVDTLSTACNSISWEISAGSSDNMGENYPDAHSLPEVYDGPSGGLSYPAEMFGY